jgi:hypothetical protein
MHSTKMMCVKAATDALHDTPIVHCVVLARASALCVVLARALCVVLARALCVVLARALCVVLARASALCGE